MIDRDFIAIMQKLVNEQGRDALLDAKKCKAFLADYAHNEYHKECHLLLQALEADIARKIDVEPEFCRQQQIRTLHEEYFVTEEAAEDIVDMLFLILRGEVVMAEEKKVSEKELANYAKHYDRNAAYRLLKKLRKATRDKPILIAGPTGAIVNTLGKLLSALDNPETPAPLKALIIGAIGYIILPFDLIPDMIPVIGYADDVASAAAVVIAVAAYSNFSLDELDAVIDSECGG